ncbi:efflux RND transporter periplasmic adaptor subunit [Wukongibacter baidiensis]|uniref:efflux RND transporter periplasmic adaptor subunit n=1 Tax=Wukongibacter baidiensis TaxID=1723361 RepID=UPI003D7FCAD5
MISKKLISIILFLMIIITGCSSNINNDEDDTTSKKIVPVEVEKVQIGSIEDKYFTVGRVEALNSVIVTSSLEGMVDQIFVKPGDKVDKGQLLYRIIIDENFKEVKLKYESAAKEKEARNKAYLDTKDQFDKVNHLYKQGSISESKLKEMKLELEQSKIQLNIAKRTLETALEVYNMSKNRYEIKSPISGYVSISQVKTGQNVTSEQIIKINGKKDKVVILGIPEEYIDKITLDTDGKIKVNSVNKVYDGKVVEISPEIDKSSSLYPIKVSLEGGEGLIDGLYAEAELILNVFNDQIMVPNKSIVFEEDQPFVFKVSKNNRPLKVNIDIGISKGERVQVLQGLKKGDIILAKGQHFVDHNSLIEIVNNE